MFSKLFHWLVPELAALRDEVVTLRAMATRHQKSIQDLKTLAVSLASGQAGIPGDVAAVAKLISDLQAEQDAAK